MIDLAFGRWFVHMWSPLWTVSLITIGILFCVRTSQAGISRRWYRFITLRVLLCPFSSPAFQGLPSAIHNWQNTTLMVWWNWVNSAKTTIDLRITSTFSLIHWPNLSFVNRSGITSSLFSGIQTSQERPLLHHLQTQQYHRVAFSWEPHQNLTLPRDEHNDHNAIRMDCRMEFHPERLTNRTWKGWLRRWFSSSRSVIFRFQPFIFRSVVHWFTLVAFVFCLFSLPCTFLKRNCHFPKSGIKSCPRILRLHKKKHLWNKNKYQHPFLHAECGRKSTFCLKHTQLVRP